VLGCEGTRTARTKDYKNSNPAGVLIQISERGSLEIAWNGVSLRCQSVAGRGLHPHIQLFGVAGRHRPFGDNVGALAGNLQEESLILDAAIVVLHVNAEVIHTLTADRICLA
jgi:hypothetical protein